MLGALDVPACAPVDLSLSFIAPAPRNERLDDGAGAPSFFSVEPAALSLSLFGKRLNGNVLGADVAGASFFSLGFAKKLGMEEPDELASFDAGASLFAVFAVFPPSVKGGSVGGVRVVVGAGVLGLLPSEAPPKSPPDRADVVVELVVLEELSAGLGTEPKRPPDVPVAGVVVDAVAEVIG